MHNAKRKIKRDEEGEMKQNESDYVVIRGVRLDLNCLVDKDFLKQDSVIELNNRFQNGKPFPHLVLDNLFDTKLLDLVHDEFDMCKKEDWVLFSSKNEKIYRTPPKPLLGNAAELYFSTISSSRFINFLSQVTGIENLIPDPQLVGGGMHEVREGGKFAIHIDFDKHRKSLLDNELVFITYLNKNWQASWNGALELWDADKCIRTVKVLPEFGRTIIFRHSNKSLHGHPRPLKTPEGITRRSVTCYYYSNRQAEHNILKRHSTLFFVDGKIDRLEVIRRFIINAMPNVVLLSVDTVKQNVKKRLPAKVLQSIRRMKGWDDVNTA